MLLNKKAHQMLSGEQAIFKAKGKISNVADLSSHTLI